MFKADSYAYFCAIYSFIQKYIIYKKYTKMQFRLESTYEF